MRTPIYFLCVDAILSAWMSVFCGWLTWSSMPVCLHATVKRRQL
jgi:hypothetical protein